MQCCTLVVLTMLSVCIHYLNTMNTMHGMFLIAENYSTQTKQKKLILQKVWVVILNLNKNLVDYNNNFCFIEPIGIKMVIQL